jgi:glycerophosphoryl diester phosphodiesterase
VIGHRGAPTLAPENTLRSFGLAVDHGVDLVEFDVIALPRGPLVVAHSDRLEEITHGAVRGRVHQLTLEGLRSLAPELPTLDEALAFLAAASRDVGLHVDLKLDERLEEVASALARHGVGGRTVVTSCRASTLRAIGRLAPDVRTGLTYPDDRFGVSRRPWLHPAVRVGLQVLRASVPRRVGDWLRDSGASALMLQHVLVTPGAVRSSHAAGVPVIAWTVDENPDVQRVLSAGVDGIVTNDPVTLLATLAT